MRVHVLVHAMRVPCVRLRVEAEAEQRQQAGVAAGAEQLNLAH